MRSKIGITPVMAVACVAGLTAGWCADAQAVLQTSPDLPPLEGFYWSGDGESDFAQYYPPLVGTVRLDDIRHFGFTDIVRTPDGLDELETFNSTLTTHAILNGSPIGYQTLTGPVTIRVSDYTSGMTGTFVAEMVSMSLSGTIGGSPVQVRESPLLASTGQTTITDVGGGLYNVDSFFDVFTEMNVQGTGWAEDVVAPTLMTLTPEPTTLSLLALGGLALLRRWR